MSPRFLFSAFVALSSSSLLLLGASSNRALAGNAALYSAMSTITADELTETVGTLADDVLEGREAGSRGGHAAGRLLDKEIENLGLQPGAGEGEYFQTFGADYRNLLALLEGGDPKLREEYLVVGAHYDHVGYGRSGNSFGPVGFIHNGADDNASGTAALLEVIEAFESIGVPPRRSILFAFWDGEEKGLLGSRHWVNNPTVPLEKVRLTINTDMVGRLRDNRLEISGSRTAQGLRRLVSQSNPSESLWLDFTWKRQANSDHWPFFERNIPYLLFHTGLHKDYHRPSDDAQLINEPGLQEVSRCLFAVVYAAANADKLPDFRSAVQSEHPSQRRRLEAPLAPAPPRLGVQWRTDPSAANSNSTSGPAVELTTKAAETNDLASENSQQDDDSNGPPNAENGATDSEPSTDKSTQPQGVLISSVRFGTPASAADLRGGDRILQFDGAPIADGDQLRRAVRTAIGETPVVVKRPGYEEPLSLKVKLPETRVRVGLAWREDPVEPGTVILTRVVPGSPAAESGLRVRDRIYQVDGEDFDGGKDFRARLLAAGTTRTLTRERLGRVRTVKLTLDNPDERADFDQNDNQKVDTAEKLDDTQSTREK